MAYCPGIRSKDTDVIWLPDLLEYGNKTWDNRALNFDFYIKPNDGKMYVFTAPPEQGGEARTVIDGRVCLRTWYGESSIANPPGSCDLTYNPGRKSCCCCVGGGWWGGGGDGGCCACKSFYYPLSLYVPEYKAGTEPGAELKYVFNKQIYNIYAKSSASSRKFSPECDFDINQLPRVNQQITFHWEDMPYNCLSPEKGKGCTTLNITVVKPSTSIVWNDPTSTIYLYPDPDTGLAILEGGGTTVDLSAKVMYSSVFGNGEVDGAGATLKTNTGINATNNFDIRNLFPSKTGGTVTLSLTYPSNDNYNGSNSSVKKFVFSNVIPTQIVWVNNSAVSVAKSKIKKNLIYNVLKDENQPASYFENLMPVLSKRDYRAKQWVPFLIDESNLNINDFHFVSDVAAPNTTFQPSPLFFLDDLYNHVDGTRVIGEGEVPMPPEILSPENKTGQVGQGFSYFIVATNGPTSYDAENLPAGLVIDRSSGLISGVPTTASDGHIITIKATTDGGTTSKTVTLLILPPPPVINSPGSTIAIVGRALNYNITATNSPTRFTATNLPAGLSINASTGLIFGTPTTAGLNIRSVITAENKGGVSAPEVLIFDIYSTEPSITSPLNRVVQNTQCRFSYTIRATGVIGVTGYDATGLPPGVSIINRASGILSGELTTPGVYSIGLRAFKGNSIMASGNLPVEVLSKANITSSLALQNKLAFDPDLSYQITTDIPVVNYTGYNLPYGVSINNGGRIVGSVPSGRSTISFGVSNINNPTSACEWSNASFNVIGWTKPSFESPALYQELISGSSVNLTVRASSGTNFVNITNLPPGLTFSYSPGSSSGRITGVSRAEGLFNEITMTASNPFAGSNSETLTLNIFRIPSVQNSSLYKAYSGQSVDFTIQAANRPTGYSASNLPAGLLFNSSSARITGRLSQVGTFNSSLRAFNRAGTGIKSIQFRVLGAPVFTNNNSLFAGLGSLFNYQLPVTNNPTGFELIGSLPQGLSLNSGIGVISGIVSSIESKTFSIRGTSPAGFGIGQYTLNVQEGVSITSPLFIDVISGKNVNYIISANNDPTGFSLCRTNTNKDCVTQISGHFLNGLSFNRSLGSITGVPTGVGSGRYLIRAFNRTSSASEFIDINIIKDKPSVSFLVSSGVLIPRNSPDPEEPVGALYELVNTPINIRWSGTNDPTSGFMNPGVSLLSGMSHRCSVGSNGFVSFCSLSGVPNAPWSYNIDLGAENLAGTSSKKLEVNVLRSVSIPNQAMSGKTGTYFFNKVEFLNDPVSFATNGTIPSGLTFNAQIGAFSGTPTATGNFNVKVIGYSKAASGRGAGSLYGAGSGDVNFSILGSQAEFPPEIISPSTTSGYIGQLFVYRVSGTNNPTGYSLSGVLPSNLMFYGGSSGIISGILTQEGESTLWLSASNRSGSSPLTRLDIKSYGIPRIMIGSRTGTTNVFLEELDPINAFPINTRLNTNIDLRFSGTNLPTSWSLSGTLNAGLSFNSSLFAITGKGTTVNEVRDVMLRAWNPAGTGTGLLRIKTATTGIPAITSSLVQRTGYLSSPFIYNITASNDPDNFNFVGDLLGLSFNGADGVISGSPAREGASNVTIWAINQNGSGSAVLPIRVIGTPSILSYPSNLTGYSGVALTNYSSDIIVESNPTGYRLNVNPALYTGVTFNSGLGIIAGTPRETGSRTMTVTPVNPAGSGSPVVFSTRIFGSPVITGGIPSSFTANTSSYIEYRILASNNPTGYTLSGTGSMFTGVSFNSGLGILSGSTSETGVKNFTFRAVNPAGTGSFNFSMSVSQLVRPPTIASNTSVGGYINNTFLYDVLVGNSPTGTIITAGTLHPGLTFNGATSSISGTTTTTGTRSVTIVASNSAGSATGVLNITMTGVPVITSSSSVTGIANRQFDYNIVATNNPTGYGYASSSFLPPGLTLAGNSIYGLPTQTGVTTVNLAAYNQAGSGNMNLRITINPGGAVPMIVSPSDGRANVEQNINNEIFLTATNNPTGWTVQNLPVGFGFNRNGPSITGRVQNGTPFCTNIADNVIITALNQFGASQPIVISLYNFNPDEC